MNKALKISIVVVLCLIVILTITLFACQGDNGAGTTTTTTTTKPTTTTSTTTSSTTSSTTSGTTSSSSSTSSSKVDPVPDPEPDVKFTETNDKVYVISDGLHIRSSAEKTEDNKLGWVEQDTELIRLGYYENGWSKIKYEDKECFVSTDCLTTSKPIKNFSPVSETVYFVHSALAFTKPSHIEDYSVADFTFSVGEQVKRTGIATVKYVAEDGKEYKFARIEFTVTENGESKTITRYVNNAYLSTDKPTAPNPDGDITFTKNSDVLVVKEATGSIKIRKSTKYVAGSDDEVAFTVEAGTELQAVGKGTESDKTIWYKVQYEDGIYYVIYQAYDKAAEKYKDPYFTIK